MTLENPTERETKQGARERRQKHSAFLEGEKKKEPILERETAEGACAMVQIARRKKGRPSKADLARRSGESQSDPRRSLRRRSVRYNIIDYDGDYLDDDEEDERRREKKKLKLMAKLNQDGGEEEEEEET